MKGMRKGSGRRAVVGGRRGKEGRGEEVEFDMQCFLIAA